MEKVVEIKNLKKYYYLFKKDYKKILWTLSKKGNYAEKKVLDNLNFELYKGEVLGIVGKNGAGKSTVLKLIAGITYPTGGEISVTGKVGSLINLGAGFNSEYTGRENIYYKALVLGMKESDVDNIIEDIQEFADIDDYFDLPLKTYSSGMSARLGFALAIFSDPDILLIDEVFAVGDKDFREKSLQKTKEMFTSGKSIIFTSHSEGQIRAFCTRLICLDKGKIIFDGDVSEGLKVYNNL